MLIYHKVLINNKTEQDTEQCVYVEYKTKPDIITMLQSYVFYLWVWVFPLDKVYRNTIIQHVIFTNISMCITMLLKVARVCITFI